MAYKQRTVRVDLSGFDDGLYAVLRNPRLFLRSGDLPSENETPHERVELVRATLAQLIVEWKVWDLSDEDGETPLPLPSEDATALTPERCPEAVLATLMREVITLTDPQ